MANLQKRLKAIIAHIEREIENWIILQEKESKTIPDYLNKHRDDIVLALLGLERDWSGYRIKDRNDSPVLKWVHDNYKATVDEWLKKEFANKFPKLSVQTKKKLAHYYEDCVYVELRKLIEQKAITDAQTLMEAQPLLSCLSEIKKAIQEIKDGNFAKNMVKKSSANRRILLVERGNEEENVHGERSEENESTSRTGD